LAKFRRLRPDPEPAVHLKIPVLVPFGFELADQSNNRVAPRMIFIILTLTPGQLNNKRADRKTNEVRHQSPKKAA
jgi:hypothetical protein